MISTKKKVLVIMTGGTICSARGNNRLNDLDTDNAVLTLLSMYQEQTGDYDKEILTASPINTLSENMTIDKWNLLLSELAKYKASEELEGIIILHGTDTLHLTAPLVAEYMKGAKVPAILISSQRILEDPEANGVMNLMVGMKLIELGIPGVYVPFRNMDGRMFLHLAEDLEEERRMLYVGMTRAKSLLYLSAVKTRFEREQKISSFLRPLIRAGEGEEE